MSDNYRPQEVSVFNPDTLKWTRRAAEVSSTCISFKWALWPISYPYSLASREMIHPPSVQHSVLQGDIPSRRSSMSVATGANGVFIFGGVVLDRYPTTSFSIVPMRPL